LISKQEELIAKESLIEEKERLFISLKSILQKTHPSSELREQIENLKSSLTQKKEQFKKLDSDRIAFKLKCQSHKLEIDRLQREIGGER
jgi:hypothetical protein